MKPMAPPVSMLMAAKYGSMYGAQRARAAAQAQVTYQNKLAGCRTQCAPRPVLWQQHCRDLCMEGKVMPRIGNEPWPPAISGMGQLPEPLGVPLWGWALGIVGAGAVIYLISR
jgi:hypothetical protein